MTKGIRLIERANLVMVPILILLVVIIFIWSLTRQGALHGIRFFFTPDWGK
jgi:NSS family neurotransmitter:Na+ symporter